MPKGKSAKEYKAATKLNNFIGAVMFVALLVGLYIGFQLLMKLEFLENKTAEGNQIHNTQKTGGGKEKMGNTVKNVKDAADINKKIDGIR